MANFLAGGALVVQDLMLWYYSLRMHSFQCLRSCGNEQALCLIFEGLHPERVAVNVVQ
jgi:hypothetical protein